MLQLGLECDVYWRFTYYKGLGLSSSTRFETTVTIKIEDSVGIRFGVKGRMRVNARVKVSSQFKGQSKGNDTEILVDT